jgi:hypothetical protein
MLNSQTRHRPYLFCFFNLIYFFPTAVFSQHIGNIQKTKASTPYQQKDTANWVVNFEQFRDALYQKNKAKTKLFFDFPIDTDSGELWYVALGGLANAADVATTSRDFTAKDLDKYYENIFPAALIKGFLKIRMKELYAKGYSESPEWKKDQTTYQLRATYDQKARIIELNLSTHSAVKVSANETDPVESNLVYRFSIRPNGHIKFRQLFIAG